MDTRTEPEHARQRGAAGGRKPTVAVTFREALRATYLAETDWQRLSAFAEPVWVPGDETPRPFGAPAPEPSPALLAALEDAEALVICHGAPLVDDALLARAPRLRFVGELEGDRFAARIDIPATRRRGITVVDTTNGSSYPVAEWALALMMIGLRNAAAHFRRLIAGERVHAPQDDVGYATGELTGKRVGLIGCGHIGRRLLELLRPFQVAVRVYDPYLAPEVADVYDLRVGSLEAALTQSEVVVCLAPLTPRTRGMLGASELDLLPPNSVFVNVSRGAIVDSAALLARLTQGDGVRAALDVFDPEPVPVDGPLSAIRHLENVFLSPHIAGVTAASRPRFFALMVDELDRVLHGDRPRFALDDRSLANRRGE